MLSVQDKILGNVRESRLVNAGIYFVILSGIFLRICFYAANRGLWNDELSIAVNIVERSFAGLATPPLAYDQQAPLLFLFALKGFALLFNSYNELALRLFPLASGVAATILFYFLAKATLPRKWVLLAQVCFSFGIYLIYYSAEVKQYETEALAAIVAYLLFFYFESRQGLVNALVWGVAGGLLLWFSYSVVFILAAVGGFAFLDALLHRRFRRLTFLSPVGAIWLTSFLINYQAFMVHGTQLDWLNGFWSNKDAFMPLPPRNIGELLWLPKALLQVVSMPLGMKWPLFSFSYKLNLLPVLLMVGGAFHLIRTNRRLSFLLLLPLLLVLLVSSTGKYPFSGRLLLFYAPVFIILITYGVIFVVSPFRQQTRAVFATAALVVIPVVWNGLSIISSDSKENKTYFRDVLVYITSRAEVLNARGVPVYFHQSLAEDVRYYKQLYRMPALVSIGRTPLLASSSDVPVFQEAVRRDLRAFIGKEEVLVVIPKDEVVPFYREKGQQLPGEMALFKQEIAALGNVQLIKETPREQLYSLTLK